MERETVNEIEKAIHRSRSRQNEVLTVNGRNATLGTCPRCEAPIPRSSQLIEYETTDGSSNYAECPECGDVVRPE